MVKKPIYRVSLGTDLLVKYDYVCWLGGLVMIRNKVNCVVKGEMVDASVQIYGSTINLGGGL